MDLVSSVLAMACFALAALLGVMATRPRKILRATKAWRSSRPDLYEPSDAHCAVASIVWGVVGLGAVGYGIVFVVLAITGNPVDNERERREEARAECEAVMDELDDVFTDVDHLDPVRRTARELGVRIEVRTVQVADGELEPFTLVQVMRGDEMLGSLGPTDSSPCITIGL
jgi:hypothetical protein